MHQRLFVLAALLVAPGALQGAGDATLDRGTLRGLKAISVVVDLIDPQLEQEGLTKDYLEKELASRLLNGGIVINKQAVEFVGLKVTEIREKKAPYSLYLSLGLYQPVILSRDKNIRTATQTWETGTILTAQPKVLMQSARSAADYLADKYIDAWRSVNPQ